MNNWNLYGTSGLPELWYANGESLGKHSERFIFHPCKVFVAGVGGFVGDGGEVLMTDGKG